MVKPVENDVLHIRTDYINYYEKCCSVIRRQTLHLWAHFLTVYLGKTVLRTQREREREREVTCIAKLFLMFSSLSFVEFIRAQWTTVQIEL